MGKKPQHRAALIESAIRLFRRRGYAGTGTKDILADSGAPRGSLYHYFPGGKEQIGALAVETAGAQVTGTLDALAAEAASPAEFVVRYLELLAQWMTASGFRDGCPIATTLLETTPDSLAIGQAGRNALDDWQAVIERLLERHGWPPARAPATAATVIATIEGALILSRVQASAEPLHRAAGELGVLLGAGEAAESLE